MKIAYRYRGAIRLALLLLILPWLTIRYALSDTVAAWFECRALHSELSTLLQTSSDEESTQNLMDQMLLGGEAISALQPVAAAHNVTISDYKPYITQQSNGLEIHTASIVFAGRYADLLHVIDEAGQRLSPCRFASLRFTAITPPNRASKRLEATLYIQQAVQIHK